MGVITVTFFDKMSCRRARVKIKIGMVTFSHPPVFLQEKNYAVTIFRIRHVQSVKSRHQYLRFF